MKKNKSQRKSLCAVHVAARIYAGRCCGHIEQPRHTRVAKGCTLRLQPIAQSTQLCVQQLNDRIFVLRVHRANMFHVNGYTIVTKSRYISARREELQHFCVCDAMMMKNAFVLFFLLQLFQQVKEKKSNGASKKLRHKD